jgi:MazG family protein
MSESTRAGDAFARLVEIMATLRGPSGCPWDRAQTIDSLKPFVLEETYEVLDAIDRGDHEALREEIGDHVFEAVFLAQLEHEAGRFAIADSLTAVADKLVRRHPHVFDRSRGPSSPDPSAAGGEQPSTPAQVKARWEEIKAQERAAGAIESRATGHAGAAADTLLSGIARTLPALARAFHIGTRAASVGFDWPRADDVLEKLQEEVNELRAVIGAAGAKSLAGDTTRAEEEMGDLLFAIANLARKLGIEPETALRKANDKFMRRFTDMERRIAASGVALGSLSLAQLESEWQRSKAGG